MLWGREITTLDTWIVLLLSESTVFACIFPIWSGLVLNCNIFFRDGFQRQWEGELHSSKGKLHILTTNKLNISNLPGKVEILMFREEGCRPWAPENISDLDMANLCSTYPSWHTNTFPLSVKFKFISYKKRKNL